MNSFEEVFRWHMPGEPPKAGEIWPWTGPVVTDSNGKYGIIILQKNKVRTHVLAHRFSYELYIGPIPDGHVIRHKNDVPIDVNPHNLEPGTQADNVRDMFRRNRNRSVGVSGSSNGMSKLTEDQIREIRYLRNECGWKLAELSQRFGIGESALSAIARRVRWSHVA